MRKIILLLLILSIALHAKTGFAFLKTEYSPEYISTAGIYSLKSNDGGVINYNPALLFNATNHTFKAAYRKHIEDSTISELSYSEKNSMGYFGASIEYFSIDGFEARENPSVNPDYNFDSSDLIISVGYATEVYENISVGVKGSFLQEEIDYDNADGYAFSFGIATKDLLIDGLGISLSGDNFGYMDEMNEEKIDLPSSVSFGAGYNYSIDDFSLFGGFYNKYILDDEENLLNLGFEAGYQDMVFARAGYRLENEGQPVSFGLGFKVYNGEISYAYSPFEDDLGDSHGIAVKYSF